MDTQGWLLLLKVLPADKQDREGGEQLLQSLEQRYGWLSKIWADGGYTQTMDRGEDFRLVG